MTPISEQFKDIQPQFRGQLAGQLNVQSWYQIRGQLWGQIAVQTRDQLWGMIWGQVMDRRPL